MTSVRHIAGESDPGTFPRGENAVKLWDRIRFFLMEYGVEFSMVAKVAARTIASIVLFLILLALLFGAMTCIRGCVIIVR